MPALPETAIHPCRTCRACRRVMLSRTWDGLVPEGAVRHGGHGMCFGCWHAARREREARERAAREAATAAGLALYMRQRRSRLARRRRAALAAAIRQGWDAV